MVCLLFSDPNSAPEGGIQIMNCVATLLTKSKTKFFIEYHSSCLESMFRPYDWAYHFGICFTMGWDDQNFISLLNVHRKSQDIGRREHGALRWVNKSSVWQPSRGKIRREPSVWTINCCGTRSSFVAFSIFSSWPPSSPTPSTFWTSTSSFVWSRQTATNPTVIDLHALFNAVALTWASLLVSYSQRWGLCRAASRPVLLQRVLDHTDSSRREDGHIDWWHPVAHLCGKVHWKVVWWVWKWAQDLLVECVLRQFL